MVSFDLHCSAGGCTTGSDAPAASTGASPEEEPGTPQEQPGSPGAQLPGDPAFKQTEKFRNWETSKFRSEKLRSWEQKMRKQEVQQQKPQPEDLQRPHVTEESHFWEVKLRKGELDPLLKKSKQTWLLDKVAEIPETLQIGTRRTFWEVKAADTSGNDKRCFSMPVRERPHSLGPSFRPSLREGLENCSRSEESIPQSVFSLHFENVDEESFRNQNVGRTLMVHDISNKLSIEGVIGIFDELGAEHVDYVFLPQGCWETTKKAKKAKKSKESMRNKSYCFVHFAHVAAADAFAERLSQYKPTSQTGGTGADARERKMYASVAVTQGVLPNLLRLIDIHSKKWHPRAGALAIRLEDSLVLVKVLALRKFLLDIIKDDPKNIPGCLRKECTFSSSCGPSAAEEHSESTRASESINEKHSESASGEHSSSGEA